MNHSSLKQHILRVIVAGALSWVANSAYAVWQLDWSDEFNGTSVASTNWTYDIGNGCPNLCGWGNNELEYYTSRTQNVYVANGLLHIVAQQESYSNYNYTSAKLKSTGLFTQQYGRFEWRAKLPLGTGTWPALWMLPQNGTYGGWPNNGEIDVVENKGTNPTQEGGTIHYGGANGGDVYSGMTYTFPSGDGVTNFHIYALEWTSNSVKWFVDNVLYETQTNWWSNVGTSTNRYPYPAPFNQPFYIVMNLAIGGNYLGNPTTSVINSGTAFPVEMQVDYVRAYHDVPATGPPAAPTGLGAGAGNGTAYLNWDASSTGATGYNIKRATVSGGPYALVGSSGANSYADSSVFNCSTYYYVVSATNSFGESPNSSEITVPLGASTVAINSGGSGVNEFMADADFSGGTQSTPTSNVIDTSEVTNPAPQAVYQSERYGNCTYTIPGLIAGRTYKVRLHFAEIYWSSVGQRVFNVSINGNQVLTNFDIIAAAGAANRANIQEFTATASSAGEMTIQYVTVTDNAKSSGIEVLLPRTATPVAANNGPLYDGMTLNLTAATVPGATYNWSGPNGFTSSSQNPSLNPATTNASGTYTVTATVGGCVSSPGFTVVSVNPLPSISIQPAGTNFALAWPSGTLQSSTNLPGNWSNLVGATSPYTATVNGPQQFFRLKLP